MKILVQKFGGTSLDTEENRRHAAWKVKEAVQTGYGVVVVVSAMGRGADYPYSTDTLIGLMSEEIAGSMAEEMDLLLSCGEIISAVVFAGVLRGEGCESCAMSGRQAGIQTGGNFGEAHIRRVRPDRILERLHLGQVVVVAGFQGVSDTGCVTTLGRGGSDITAAALGCALEAEKVEVFTDVDGIMTADPRVVSGATRVKRLTYREVCEMAHLGAKVIHPRAAEIATEGGVPLWIRNTFSHDEGTLIADRLKLVEGIPIKGDTVVSGIAHITELAQVKVSTGDVTAGKRLEVLKALAEAGISLDLINVSPQEMCFTIKEAKTESAKKLLKSFDLDVRIEKGFAKVSAVGAGMRGVPGVMASIVESLTASGIEIHQSADSHTSISCLVRSEDLCGAATALHNCFGLSQ